MYSFALYAIWALGYSFLSMPDVVMTPSKRGKVTLIKIERRKKQAINQNDVVHEAGGQHKGLVINRPGECFTVYGIQTVSLSAEYLKLF